MGDLQVTRPFRAGSARGALFMCGSTAAAPHSILLSCLLFMLNKVWLPVISLGVGQTKKEVGHRVAELARKKSAAQPRPDFPWYDANRIECTATEHFHPIREAPDVAAFGRPAGSKIRNPAPQPPEATVVNILKVFEG